MVPLSLFLYEKVINRTYSETFSLQELMATNQIKIFLTLDSKLIIKVTLHALAKILMNTKCPTIKNLKPI